MTMTRDNVILHLGTLDWFDPFRGLPAVGHEVETSHGMFRVERICWVWNPDQAVFVPNVYLVDVKDTGERFDVWFWRQVPDDPGHDGWELKGRSVTLAERDALLQSAAHGGWLSKWAPAAPGKETPNVD